MKLTAVPLVLFMPLFLHVCHTDTGQHAGQSDAGEGQQRSLRYHPDQGDFIILNGDRRFNRALYGTHTGFRVEAGDLPEFAMYLRGMGGNLKLGLVSGDSSIWLTDAKEIEARYRPGSMLYQVKDPLMGDGTLHLHLLALAAEEGLILKVTGSGLGEEVKLFWAYGGANGQRFSRDGDLGAAPESVFYLKPEYCRGNRFDLNGHAFSLLFTFARNGDAGHIYGLVPPGGEMKICDSERQESPLGLFRSEHWDRPLIAGILDVAGGGDQYFILSRDVQRDPAEYAESPGIFAQAEKARQEVAGRIAVRTPDEFVNNYGSALAIAADAIWEDPVFLHGAVAWRSPLQGWRGAYAGDWLGWHARAQSHFRGYGNAQYTEPETGPVAPDPETNLSRQKEEKGKSIFIRGYISRTPNRIGRPHHYDMNLVFVDQLLWHIQWTGDLQFAREMWPVITRHLVWEKQCFDGNRDGLYDSYASIWASDALQYSGGGVTHSSAYNFRANRMAALIAAKIGEDPGPYLEEAERILTALNSELWMPGKGWYGEYKDLLGLQRVHDMPAIWTIYHALDEGIADPLQAWQSLEYVNRHIPHIPIPVAELPDERYYSLSTTRWMPYEWSINNMALAENLHMALAYWQGGDPERAFRLWKSQILESMYLGGSPGNFQQLSSLDKFRGELYRDFADPIGMGARTLVEGLFGFQPRLLEGVVVIRPGLPAEWEFASLKTPDLSLDYRRRRNKETWEIRHHLPGQPGLVMKIPARSDRVASLKVNGSEIPFSPDSTSVGRPQIVVQAPWAEAYRVDIAWKGSPPEQPVVPDQVVDGHGMETVFARATVTEVNDPQGVLNGVRIRENSVTAQAAGTGARTFFIKVHQGDLVWWEPVEAHIRDAVGLVAADRPDADNLAVQVLNHTREILEGELTLRGREEAFGIPVEVGPGAVSPEVVIPGGHLMPGTNVVVFRSARYTAEFRVTRWQEVAPAHTHWQTIDLEGHFNDPVTRIFENEYLSPRCPYPTLQLPLQGIGDWCAYSKTAHIEDAGLREKSGAAGIIHMDQGIPLATPGKPEVPNIVFTSLWDNYPDSAVIALDGRASHAYLLMAGSTHHMQSRIPNGEVTFRYKDGSFERLELTNPDTWWPIEQDYFIDEHAFRVDAPRPPRVHLRTGQVPDTPYEVLNVNKTNHIHGGAATLLDLPLDPGRELESLCLRTLSNDVVIGLMAVTLAVGED